MKELVNTEAKDLWGSFEDGVLETCKVLCGKRKQRRERGSTRWWNEEVQEAINRKKNRFRKMCKMQSEENKDNYKRKRNQIRKIVSRAMRESEQEMNDLCDKRNNVFKLVKF